MPSPSAPEPATTPPAVTVLGRVTVRGADGRAIEPPGARSRTLVVALVLAGHAGASVARLVDDLWGDETPRDARAALQALVSRLRRHAAESTIVSTAAGYALAASAASDLELAERRRESAARLASAGDADAAAREAGAGLALWTGPVGADLPEGGLADDLRRRADRLADELRRTRAAGLLDAGRAGEALADLDLLGETHPFDERVAALRMRALAAAGRPADALSIFAEFRTRVRDEFGSDPSAELVELNARMLRSGSGARRASAPPGVGGTAGPAARSGPDTAAPGGRATDGHATDESPLLSRSDAAASRPQRLIGLRTAPNALLGRAQDLDALAALLAASRLTTILGVGGLGKTRLALETARREAGSSAAPDVVVVELAGVRTDDDVAQAIAFTLGIRELQTGRVSLSDPIVRQDVREHILSSLSRRPTLLVLDNCEHVIDAAAHWADDILAALGEVRILATSRTPLAIAGERAYPLAPLESAPVRPEADRATDGPAGTSPAPGATDAAAYGPAVELFVERARAARPGASLPLPTIARLCRRLDGLPLAIELAAARIRSMPVDEIERRLEDRFALLTAGERTAPERHRTLFAVIDWSWNLLGADERTLLRRLSIFPDGFGAEAAEAVGAAGPGGIGPGGTERRGPGRSMADALDGLVMQSLVTASESPADGAMRYRMLETVREFGEHELGAAGDADTAEAGMRAWATAFCARMLVELDTTGPVGYRVVGEELDNLIAVLRRATADGDAETTVTVFALLAIFWMLRGSQSDLMAFAPTVGETIRGHEPDAAHRDATMMTLVFVSALAGLGMARIGLPALARLRRMHRERPAEDPDVGLLVELILAMVTGPREVITLLDRRSADPSPRSAAIADLVGAQLDENNGELARAIACAERCRELGVAGHSVWLPANGAQMLAEFHSQSGNAPEALEWARRARDEFAEMQDSRGTLVATITLQLDWLEAVNLLSRGDVAAAKPLLHRFTTEEADEFGFDAGDRRGMAAACRAEISLASGDTAEGLRGYREAATGLDAGYARSGPWTLTISAGCLAAHIAAGHDDPLLPDLARRLRIRMLVSHRLRRGQNDVPVAAAGARALGLWLATHGTADAARAGLSLVALSARAGARQDLPSLHTDRVLRVLTLSEHGAAAGADDEVDDVIGRVADVSPRQAYQEIHDTLGRPEVREALAASDASRPPRADTDPTR